ncbi:MAG: pilus assembly protein [Deltaproteobacteria bacterium]|nr:pilus assembly protein [Deltaproteobacteria bacterium]
MKKYRLPKSRGKRPGGQSGQVEVETAIVLPMVIFLLLGLIQLGLLHQARIIGKYAAYRAVRTGSLKNGNVDEMERAALAVALPILSWRKGSGWPEVIGRTDTATNWMKKWIKPGFGSTPVNTMTDCGVPYVEVEICGPKQSDVSGGTYKPGDKELVSFDHKDIASSGIDTKLRIQLTLNYRMIIPFADWVIHRMWRGERILKELHLDNRKVAIPNMDVPTMIRAAAEDGIYIIPIKTHYSMKLHSDMPKELLPTDDNVCVN